ncbi:MAG: hypothetical protein PVF17_03670 [Ignavibacteria bacterium]|jgi:hypothetical protein
MFFAGAVCPIKRKEKRYDGSKKFSRVFAAESSSTQLQAESKGYRGDTLSKQLA